MKKNTMYIVRAVVMLCFILALFHAEPLHASEGKIYITIFSNQNYILNGGHAFLKITNDTDEDVYIGPFCLPKGEYVYIDARGDVLGNSYEKYIQDFGGGAFFDYIAAAEEGYKGFSSFTVEMNKNRLDDVFQCMKDFSGTYEILTNNCVDFAVKVWNRVVSPEYQIEGEYFLPAQLKKYLIDNFGAKEETGLQESNKNQYDVFQVTKSGHLAPIVLTHTQYEKNIDKLSVEALDCESIEVNWFDMAMKISANDRILTGYEIEYSGGGVTKTVTVGYDQTSYVIEGLQSGQEYTVRMRGIRDYRYEGAGYLYGRYSVSQSCKTKKHSITLKQNGVSIKVGESIRLESSFTCRAVHTNTPSLKWSSSNSSVASVSSIGNVTGNKKGTATVNVKIDGVSAKCKITVLGMKRYDYYKEVGGGVGSRTGKLVKTLAAKLKGVKKGKKKLYPDAYYTGKGITIGINSKASTKSPCVYLKNKGNAQLGFKGIFIGLTIEEAEKASSLRFRDSNGKKTAWIGQSGRVNLKMKNNKISEFEYTLYYTS